MPRLKAEATSGQGSRQEQAEARIRAAKKGAMPGRESHQIAGAGFTLGWPQRLPTPLERPSRPKPRPGSRIPAEGVPKMPVFPMLACISLVTSLVRAF